MDLDLIIKQRKDTDVAWCAGFFDGEGHVAYTRSTPSLVSGHVTRGIRCYVPQKSDNVEVLERFQRIVGMGTLQKEHPMPNGKPQNVLTFGIKEVKPLFEMLKPYLATEKWEAFDRALMMLEYHDPKPTPEDYAKLRRRNEKKRLKSLEKA